MDTIQNIRTKYLDERGDSTFNKFNANDYTRFLEKEIIKLFEQMPLAIDRKKQKKQSPTDIAGYQIDWKTKTVSVPQGVQMYCNNIYNTLEDTAKELGLKIQLSL